MLKKILLPTILLVPAYGFWVSPNFKVIAAGIAIFLFGLGTTTGAWLIAGFGLKVNIAAYAMPMLVFGVVLIFQSSNSLKGIGYILSKELAIVKAQQAKGLKTLQSLETS